MVFPFVLKGGVQTEGNKYKKVLKERQLCLPDGDMDIAGVGLCAIHKRPPGEAKGCTTEMSRNQHSPARGEEASSV